MSFNHKLRNRRIHLVSIYNIALDCERAFSLYYIDLYVSSPYVSVYPQFLLIEVKFYSLNTTLTPKQIYWEWTHLHIIVAIR